MTWSRNSFYRLPQWLVAAAWCSLTLSCVSLRSVSLTSVPAGRDSVVQAKESEFLVFGIATNNDFVDDVARTLGRQCQGGRIQGILTKHYQTIYVYWLLEKRTVEARGYCSLPIIDTQKRVYE
jgi:hypothetical protein